MITPRPCSQPGCDEPRWFPRSHMHGYVYCRAHYMRWWAANWAGKRLAAAE